MDRGARLAAGRYSAAPSTLADGEEGALLIDNGRRIVPVGYDTTAGVYPVGSKPIASSTYTFSHGGDYALAAAMTAVIKSSAGVLAGVEFENTSGSDVWLQVWNRVAVPVSGVTATTVVVTPLNWLIRAGTAVRQGAAMFGANGWLYSNGIVWAISTRKADFTVPAAGQEVFFTIHLLTK